MSYPGKKYVVISREEYEMLKNKICNENKLHNPEKRELQRSEMEIKHVWDKDIPADEKIRLFTEELNNLKSRYDELTKAKPLKVVMEKNLEDNKNNAMDSNIIKSLPKNSQSEGELILNHLRKYPEVITWNERGEIIFKGDVVPGSNLTDLVSSVTTARKSNLPVFQQTVFLKALSETNTPESWIKNRGNKKLLQSYKNIKEDNPFSSPDEKKIKINWSSF